MAVTYAANRKWAVAHFRQIYPEASLDNVHEVLFNADGIATLTDY